MHAVMHAGPVRSFWKGAAIAVGSVVAGFGLVATGAGAPVGMTVVALGLPKGINAMHAAVMELGMSTCVSEPQQ